MVLFVCSKCTFGRCCMYELLHCTQVLGHVQVLFDVDYAKWHFRFCELPCCNPNLMQVRVTNTWCHYTCIIILIYCRSWLWGGTMTAISLFWSKNNIVITITPYMSSFIIKYLIKFLLNILFGSLFVVMLVEFNISKALTNYDYWESFIMLSFFFLKIRYWFCLFYAYQHDRVLFASLMLLEMILTTICNTGWRPWTR